jgi:hypothetical protein
MTSSSAQLAWSDATRMFPALAPDIRALAYALIDAGLCFHTCPPNCQGRCIDEAERAVKSIAFLAPAPPVRSAGDDQ